MHTIKKTLLATALASALFISGCGSSGSSNSDVTINGVAIAGPVDGTVTVTDTTGMTLATGNVAGGAFSIKLASGQLGMELDFEVTGSYTDEVSGSNVTLSMSNPLALRLAANALAAESGANIAITPETTIIRQLVVGSGKSLVQAEADFMGVFGHLPDIQSSPFDPSQASPEDVSDRDKQAAFMVGAYSQWGNDLGLSGNELAQLPSQIAADIADGALDGVDASGNPVVIGASMNMQQLHEQSSLAARYLTAMASFAGSAMNSAGLTAPSSGLPSSGVSDAMTPAMPASRTITLSDASTVSVEVLVDNPQPLGDMPLVARSRHEVRLRNASAQPIDITAWGGSAAFTADAMMHMLSGKSHATSLNPNYLPSESDPANGLYVFDIYYLMASSMMTGGMMAGAMEMEDSASDMMTGIPQPMGVWDLGLLLTEADGTPHKLLFHPEVKMAMDGSIFRANAANPADAPLMNGEASPRPYFLWLHALSNNNAGGQDIDLFVSTRKSMMMFPGVKTGLALGMSMDGSMVAPYVEGVELKLDLDGDGSYETTLDGGTNNGHFTANGVTLMDIDGDGMLMDVIAELTVTLGTDNDPGTTDDQTTFSMSSMTLAFKRP